MKKLNFKETQKAIFFINHHFTSLLAKELNLQQVQAPLIIDPIIALNDNLTGNNLPVKFNVDFLKKDLEIVQSLAK